MYPAATMRQIYFFCPLLKYLDEYGMDCWKFGTYIHSPQMIACYNFEILTSSGIISAVRHF